MSYCWYQPCYYKLVVASNSPPALNDLLLVPAFLHKIDMDWKYKLIVRLLAQSIHRQCRCRLKRICQIPCFSIREGEDTSSDNQERGRRQLRRTWRNMRLRLRLCFVCFVDTYFINQNIVLNLLVLK